MSIGVERTREHRADLASAAGDDDFHRNNLFEFDPAYPRRTAEEVIVILNSHAIT